MKEKVRNKLTRDPVKWANVFNITCGSIITVLLTAGFVSEKLAGVVVGVVTALSAAVGMLFVNNQTVSIQALKELKDAEETANPESTGD